MREEGKHFPRWDFGDFADVQVVGSGGFGTVYRATDSTGRVVALKVLRPELADNPNIRKRLEREASALRAVSGNRTVKVLDVVTTGPSPYIVMEYLQGPNLEQLVTESGAISGPLLWFMTEGLIEALRDIHSAGVVHRDLKPSNVIFGLDGLKVLDFGVSSIGESSDLTNTGSFIGTAAWLSPEQITNGTSTRASDVFNLGLLVGYLALGQHPYGLGRSDALMFRICNLEPEVSTLPSPIRDLVQRCLSRQPSLRPSVEELIAFAQSNGTLWSSPSTTPSSSEVQESELQQIVEPVGNQQTLVIQGQRSLRGERQQSDTSEQIALQQRRRFSRQAKLLGMFLAVATVAMAVLIPVSLRNNDRKQSATTTETSPATTENQDSKPGPSAAIETVPSPVVSSGKFRHVFMNGAPARWTNCAPITVSYEVGSLPQDFQAEQVADLRTVVSEISALANLPIATKNSSSPSGYRPAKNEIHLIFLYDYYGYSDRDDSTVSFTLGNGPTSQAIDQFGNLYTPITAATGTMMSTIPGNTSTSLGRIRVLMMKTLGLSIVDSDVDLLGAAPLNNEAGYGSGDLKGLQQAVASVCSL